MLFSRSKSALPAPGEALPGRAEQPFALSATHAVLKNPIEGDVPTGYAEAIFGLGCFWGAEQLFWQTPGVWSTAAGYAGGQTPHPTYGEVCSGRTGHAEVVRVVFDPAVVSYEQLLKIFWEAHDPTQGFRQGNDVGTQYRSAIYPTSDTQLEAAKRTRDAFAPRLRERGYGDITTEIVPAGQFYYAEDYHQQYLHKVPHGYCGIGGTGVSCPGGGATE